MTLNLGQIYHMIDAQAQVSEPHLPVTGYSIDSRTIGKGQRHGLAGFAIRPRAAQVDDGTRHLFPPRGGDFLAEIQ